MGPEGMGRFCVVERMCRDSKMPVVLIPAGCIKSVEGIEISKNMR